MMGIAAGLTIGGKIPFTGTFANFSTGRVYDQIRQSIAYSGKNVKICAAESITGGRFAFEIIKNENASKIFDYGLVTYSHESKSNILGLKDKINKTNVVSTEMSKYMVKEVTKFSNHKKVLAVSCTGQAGPTVLNTNYPIGTVFIGVSYKERIFSFKKCFNQKDRIYNKFNG